MPLTEENLKQTIYVKSKAIKKNNLMDNLIVNPVLT